MRQIRVWTYDVRTPEVANEIRRQSILASASADEKAVMDFIEDVSCEHTWPQYDWS